MSGLADRIRGIVGAGAPPRTQNPEPRTQNPELSTQNLEHRPPDRLDLEKVLGGAWQRDPHGSCFVVERRVGPSASYGHARVGDFAARLAESAADAPMVAGGTPARPPFVCLDLETTGLSGGAGTYAFLVGCGWFDEGGGFVTRQYVMTRYADERPLLTTVAGDLARAGALVSFNGKSFDAPVLETRYLFHRLEWPAAGLPHLDVLHPARRFWGGGVAELDRPSCSLGALEQHVLGVRRAGDIPGFEIPARYFQFVRNGDARPLAAVLEHNRRDLLSLGGLAARLLHLVRAGAAAARDPHEAFALGGLYARAGVNARAREAYERAAYAGFVGGSAASIAHCAASIAAIRIDALRALAILSRRQRQYDEAAACWRRLLDARGCPPHVVREASEALAIHHEHRLRDLAAAKTFALQSLEGGRHPAWTDAVRHRLARIERKMAGAETRGERLL